MPAVDAQAILLEIGFNPLDPGMPGQAGADEADRCMSIVAAVPAYVALLARREAGEIDGQTFRANLIELMRELQSQGAFGSNA